jgi:phosphoenolpyruvate synthase/pyruvate phosphate dikinase
LSKETVRLFEILQILAIMQDDRKMFNSQSCYFINGIILKGLAAKLGISAHEAYYIDQELIENYFSNKAEFLKRIKERAEFFVAWQKDGEKIIYEGDNAKTFVREQGINLQIENDNIKEIIGQSANKGKYSGRVRVLKTSHIQDFLKGDILVAGMTTPDFAPIMKEAGAIITDEGGITCHAAIVSRELGIPCIIGTKIATKVLKDGDLVEVDADKGIVKILGQHGK